VETSYGIILGISISNGHATPPAQISPIVIYNHRDLQVPRVKTNFSLEPVVPDSPATLPLRNHFRTVRDGYWRKSRLLLDLLHHPFIRHHARILRAEFPHLTNGSIDRKHVARVPYERNSEVAGGCNVSVDASEKILSINGQDICDGGPVTIKRYA